MVYDIASVKTRYRGFERPIKTSDFSGKRARENDKKLLGAYFRYIDLTTNIPVTEEVFEELLSIYRLFCGHDIKCEIIACDNASVGSVYGRPVEFLGIDIAYHDMNHSILNGSVYGDIGFREGAGGMLNACGLCDTEEEAEHVIKAFNDPSCTEYKLWYIYKVIV